MTTTATAIDQMDYPTTTDIFKKMIALKEAKSEIYENNSDDLDSFVYEAISTWDDFFVGDEEWSNAPIDEDADEDDECENDMKDALRDSVMEIMEENDIALEGLDNEVLKLDLETV